MTIGYGLVCESIEMFVVIIHSLKEEHFDNRNQLWLFLCGGWGVCWQQKRRLKWKCFSDDYGLFPMPAEVNVNNKTMTFVTTTDYDLLFTSAEVSLRNRSEVWNENVLVMTIDYGLFCAAVMMCVSMIKNDKYKKTFTMNTN